MFLFNFILAFFFSIIKLIDFNDRKTHQEFFDTERIEDRVHIYIFSVILFLHIYIISSIPIKY